MFSSGNTYPIVPVNRGGCRECDNQGPIGEYAMSCLARERAFEYGANIFGTKDKMEKRVNMVVEMINGYMATQSCRLG